MDKPVYNPDEESPLSPAKAYELNADLFDNMRDDSDGDDE